MRGEDLDNQKLTYDFLKLNFEEDKVTPHFNVYPVCMLSTNDYYIGAQLMGDCDCRKHLEVCNRRKKISVRLEDNRKSQIDQSDRPFTVGDLRTLLNLVGLNDLAENLMTEEDLNLI